MSDPEKNLSHPLNSNKLIETLFKYAKATSNQRIPRRESSGPISLSFSQQRLWFLDRLIPNNPIYNICTSYHVTGPLNRTILERCLREIVQRHESLRTSLKVIDDQPVQIIHPSVNSPLHYIDLTELSKHQQDKKIRQIYINEMRKPFGLTTTPLFRIIILKIKKVCHKLLIVIHHTISDGWSLSIFMSELAALYKSFRNGEPANLSELEIQYSDYAAWQQTWFQGKTQDNLISYWKRELDKYPETLNLPTDRPRPAVQTYQGSIQPIHISKQLSESLKALSHQEGATLFMTLLTTLNILLYRYTGDKDILIGSPVANRNRIGIDGMIGLFVNTIVMRTKLSGHLSFRELLNQVRAKALTHYENQEMPFEKLVEVMHPERSLAQNPLFQVMFTFHNVPKHILQFADIILTPELVHNGTSKFDLAMSLTENPEGIQGLLEYNTDLFDDATITRMVGHQQILLESIIENPNRTISQLPIMPKEERHQILVEWNKKKAKFPKDLCIHHLFEAHVEHIPDTNAAKFEEQSITYNELNRRANQLAHYLEKLSVGPETLVGLCVDRSIEGIIGILGILKAGGAYVPLNPNDPADRQAIMLDDSEVRILLTQESLIPKCSDRNSHIFCLDRDWHRLTQLSEKNPENQVKPSNLAYMIYTSGSTGRPKGVMITHENVVAFIHSYRQVTQEHEPRIGTSVSPLSFDVSVEEYWSCLCFGGTLHILRPEHIIDGVYLAKYICDHRITTIYVYPQLIPELCRHLTKMNDRLNLKYVMTGLQTKTEGTMQLLRDISKELRIMNTYGPTETTFAATAFNFQKSEHPQRDVSIGIPLPNYQIYIVDPDLQPVPIGVKGEILIGGTGLARGYRNQSELTNDKFIPNPFNEKPGSRLYRTGDMGRFSPDGNIEFLGRMDDQVKIRGYRIELGEIESVLKQHSGIKDAVVLARDDKSDESELVCYSVPMAEQAPTINEIKNYLRQKLPDYMVPSTIVLLDALPMTTSHKIDRTRLPDPEQKRSDLVGTYIAPQTPLEKVLAGIWTEVMDVEKIGTQDNFFDLGGHSLLLLQVISRIHDVFGIEISPKYLFENPTVADLAALILQDTENQERITKTAQMVLKIVRMSEKEINHLLHKKDQHENS